MMEVWNSIICALPVSDSTSTLSCLRRGCLSLDDESFFATKGTDHFQREEKSQSDHDPSHEEREKRKMHPTAQGGLRYRSPRYRDGRLPRGGERGAGGNEES